MKMPISSVHIVDDSVNVRKALSFLVTSVGISAETYSSPEDFLSHQSQDLCGCIVSDIRMPGMSGLELHRTLREHKQTIPIIFITGHSDTRLVVDAMRDGAWDFMEKPFRDQDLLDSINKALKEDARVREETLRRRRVKERLNSLTAREDDVLALIVDGKPNKVIAQDLSINERTVETHRSNVMGKMGVRSLAQLIRLVLLANTGLDPESRMLN